MHDSGVRPKANTPSGFSKTAAKVGIFPIEEVTLVEPADFLESLPSHEHAGTADPVDRRG